MHKYLLPVLSILLVSDILMTGSLAIGKPATARQEKCPIPNKYDQFLIQPFYFEEHANQTVDRPYRHGCVYYDKKTEEARRAAFDAENLAASGKYGEAETKITDAINKVDNQFAINFTPWWLLMRAKVRLIRHNRRGATADLMEALTQSDRVNALVAAKLLIEAEEYELAEKLLLPRTEKPTPLTGRLDNFYLGLAQEHIDKESAVKTLLTAAALFMEAGQTDSAQYCINRINNLGIGSHSISEIKPKREGVEKIKTVLKELVSNPKCFDYREIKSATGKQISFPAHKGVTNVIACDDIFMGLDRGVTEGPIATREKRLTIFMLDAKCGLTRADCMDLLKELPRTNSRRMFNEELITTDTYIVPSGTVALSYRNGGFQSVYQITLFSNTAKPKSATQ